MDIKARITEIEARIEQAALRSGRNIDDIRILAVTKTHPVEIMREVLAAGLLYIGENKVQESLEKIPQLVDLYREFHFIGHLQSNKVKKILGLKPALIHSIDSLRLAQKIDIEMSKTGGVQEILLQVNTSREESKFGIEPGEANALAQEINQLEHVKLVGLMTIGKFTENEAEVRQSFRDLAVLGKQLRADGIEMKWLSMGMTHDFETAVEEGANLLRLGTAIFGQRTKDVKCQIR